MEEEKLVFVVFIISAISFVGGYLAGLLAGFVTARRQAEEQQKAQLEQQVHAELISAVLRRFSRFVNAYADDLAPVILANDEDDDDDDEYENCELHAGYWLAEDESALDEDEDDAMEGFHLCAADAIDFDAADLAEISGP